MTKKPVEVPANLVTVEDDAIVCLFPDQAAARETIQQMCGIIALWAHLSGKKQIILTYPGCKSAARGYPILAEFAVDRLNQSELN